MAAAAIPLLGLVAACTGAYLYDERRDDLVPADRTVAIEGDFCTLGTNEIVRPIKILLMMDGSQSMNVTDPDGTRAKAMLQLFDALPNEKEVYVSVMLFAGSTSAFLIKTGAAEFHRVVDLTSADRLQVAQRLLNFVNTSNDPNRDATDFVKPLADAYALINRDIANSRLNATGAAAEARARYSVVFLSDGHPTNNQDDELLCGDAVTRVRQLRDLAEDVRVNTVHVFNPVQPLSSVCDLSNYTPPAGGTACRIPPVPPGACPLLLINQDAERLEKMAELGGGDFRDFRNNEPINFLNFKYGQVRRAFQLKEVVATNFSALPGSPLEGADTDGDGLSDADEATARTDAWARDTDGDGFSDGIEVTFAKQGAPFNPRNRGLPDGGGLDPGCPVSLRGVDTDCDGLYDCDEQLVGTNATRTDSDDDGIPDSIERQLGTQGSSKDLEEDPDSDGVKSGDEVRMHSDPLVPDTAKLSVNGYRYVVKATGPVDDEGRQCFRFRVDNILLANTMIDYRDGGAGNGAGLNELYFAVSMIPVDDPTARTQVRGFRVQIPRYPVGGIRSPVDGVIRVTPTELVDRCATPSQPNP